MDRMMTFSALVLVGVLLPSGLRGLPAAEDAEQRIATDTNLADASRDRGIESVYIAMSMIRDAYRVPINFEWSYVSEDRSSVQTRGFRFRVNKGETLAETLDRLCVETGGMIRWGRIHNVICVWPSGNGGTVESTLDKKVALQLSGVSTWEALLDVARQVNADDDTSRTLMPDAEPRQDQYTPPLALRDAREISLSLKDVTAREAICAIMAASPLPVEFTYGNYYRPNLPKHLPPTSTVSIRALDAEGKTLYHVPESRNSPQNYVWTNEARKAATKPNPSEVEDPD